jgi:hypothetical protein
MNDQNCKKDAGKPQLTLVPQQILYDIARVREFGIEKYHERDSWKRVDIQRYRDAAYRHFLAYLADPQGVDEESGLTHLSHLACNIAFLCDMEKDISERNTLSKAFNQKDKAMEDIEKYVERDIESLKYLTTACDYCRHRNKPEDRRCDICDPARGTAFEAMTYEDIRNSTKCKLSVNNCRYCVYYDHDIYEEPCLTCEITELSDGEIKCSNYIPNLKRIWERLIKEEKTEDGKH